MSGTELSLFEVEITGVLYVLAASQADAEKVAKDNANEEVSNLDYVATPVSSPTDIYPEWRRSLPYISGKIGGQELTCEEIAERDRI